MEGLRFVVCECESTTVLPDMVYVAVSVLADMVHMTARRGMCRG